MKIILKPIVLCFFIVSCSGVKVTSKDQIPLFFSDQKNHSKVVSVDYKIESFLWGVVPKEYSLDIDDVFMNKGYSSVAGLKIQYKNTFTDILLSVLTLGFYLPQTIILSGKIQNSSNINF